MVTVQAETQSGMKVNSPSESANGTPTFGFTLVELLVVMAVIGILAAILLPAVQSVRESARRTEYNNKIRQVGLATIAYETSHRHFPSGTNAPDHPMRPSLSWLGQILSFVEQDNLHKQSVSEFGTRTHPVGGPHLTLQTYVDLFGCPSDPRSGGPQFTHNNRLVALTSYLGVCGTNYTTQDGIFYKDSRTRTAEIRDGLSNTLMVGERPPSADNWYGWWYAGFGQAASGSPDMLLGAREINDGANYCDDCPTGPYEFSPGSIDQQCDLFHFWSMHPGGSHFVHADGAVHFHTYSIDPLLFPALATMAGGEVANWEE